MMQFHLFMRMVRNVLPLNTDRIKQQETVVFAPQIVSCSQYCLDKPCFVSLFPWGHVSQAASAVSVDAYLLPCGLCGLHTAPRSVTFVVRFSVEIPYNTSAVILSVALIPVEKLNVAS